MPSWRCSAFSSALHLLAQLQVERAERLVEQQHLRLADQRARQRHALALAARQLRRPALADARPAAPAPAARRRGARARPRAPCAPSAHRRRCRACSCAGTARSPGTRCSPAARRAGGATRPRRRSGCAPAVGSVKPPIMRRQVVLPEPEGPSRVKNSPAAIVRSTPSTARTGRRAAAEDAADVFERDGRGHRQHLVRRASQRHAGAVGPKRPGAGRVIASAAAEHGDVVGDPLVVRHALVVLASCTAWSASSRTRSCRSRCSPGARSRRRSSSALPLQAAGTAGTEPNQADRSPCSLGFSECSSHM